MIEKEFHLQFRSDPNKLPEVEAFSEQISEYVKFSSDRKGTFGMIVTEAANNSIHHGNLNNSDLLVYLSVYVLSDVLKIVIKDSGKGFNPSELPDPTEPENLLKDHGRGWLILRHFCKEVSTEIVPDGFITTLLFNRTDD